MIRPYLDDDLNARDNADFIAHIRECEACRYELETSFIVDYAVQYLDEDKMDSFDIKGLLDDQISRRETSIARRQMFSVVVWGAIVLMAVTIVLLFIRLIMPDLFHMIWSFFLGLFQPGA